MQWFYSPSGWFILACCFHHFHSLVIGLLRYKEVTYVRNHKVTAIIRDKSHAILPKVRHLEGSPTDPKLLNEALQGVDAVIVSLNINRTSDNPFARVTSPLTLISDSIRALIPAMEQNNVKRIISISAYGVGDSFKNMPLVARLLIRHSNIWKAYEDHDRQEQLLRQSKLDWTVVRPVMLNNKDTDDYKASIGKPSGSNISRKGMATFIVDALESEKYVGDCVTLFS